MDFITPILHAWTWHPLPVAVLALAAAAAALRWGRRMRWGAFTAAAVVVLLTLLSPLNTLANGVLFSAHMTQHILLLLIAPALLLASLPRGLALPGGGRLRTTVAVAGWIGGVGSMWFWHVPQLCDAAATNGVVHATQTLSLLGLGTLFWWPVFAPSEADRLAAGPGIAYLFTACLACTALGILLTLTPVQVCPIFRQPLAPGSTWASLRAAVDPVRDQQFGGLLMWVPMCLVYAGAIVLELFRWLGGRASVSKAFPEVHS